MEVSLKKEPGNKAVIRVRRTDGSVTWQKEDPFFVLHDLMHYAVETVLDYREAFFGMLSTGTDIGDFESKFKKKEIQIGEQALVAEQLVNLLTLEWNQGPLDNLLGELNNILIQQGMQINPERVSSGQVQAIREKFNLLYRQWSELNEGEIMTLTF